MNNITGLLDDDEEAKNLNLKFVFGKIKSLQWTPVYSPSDHSSVFLMGTWDDEINHLSVWRLNKNNNEPFLLQEIAENSDVNDIKYLNQDSFITANGNGSVKLYTHDHTDNISCKFIWNDLHKLISGPVSCTALAVHGNQFASVGEDGKLHILKANELKPVKSIDKDCECSVYAITFVSAHQLVTGNMQGHLKVWDLRAKDSLKSTLLSPDQVSVGALCSHPTQHHLVNSAMHDGTLAFWDMRSPSQPFVSISAHNGPILDAAFHPTRPDHLFSCGTDGKIVHWDASDTSRKSARMHIMKPSAKETLDLDDTKEHGFKNAWFSEDVKRGFLEGVNLIPDSKLPINSLCLNDDILIAGSDSECLYVASDIFRE